jgi:KipI family sensor histidine kinase inhibitor
VDAAINRRALGLAAWVRAQRWPPVRDVVPAIASVAVHFAPGHPGIQPALDLLAAHLATGGPADEPGPSALVEIPVRYGGEDGPDLDAVARSVGLAAAEVVRRHAAVVYRVLMLGFLPGFPYLGVVDPAIQVARRATPRTHVPAGSVGLAGPQTGIYPRSSPGGWQIVGRTTDVLFDPAASPPARLAPGDRVRFVPSPEGAVRPDVGRAS